MFHWVTRTTLLAVSCLIALGCEHQPSLERLQSAKETVQRVKEELPTRPATQPVAASNTNEKPVDAIRVASFNIQVFGTSKARKPQVMDVLAHVVRRFDIVAIQELRTKDETVMESFVQQINQQGAAYRYVVGPRLGRTTSKEQYIFVYDSTRVELISDTLFTINDPQDLLHREPLIAQFRARSRGAGQPFSFILVNIHTDPDETKTELDALADAFLAAQQNPWGEDDVILLGDLNVDHKKLGRLGQLPDITWTVHGEPTNTRGSKSYDNIVFNQVATSEFTGASAVLNLHQEYGLSMQQALEVSDHMPVWAEFSISEGGAVPLLARRPAAPQNTIATPPPAPPQTTAPDAGQPPSRGLRGFFNRAKEETREAVGRVRQPRY